MCGNSLSYGPQPYSQYPYQETYTPAQQPPPTQHVPQPRKPSPILIIVLVIIVVVIILLAVLLLPFFNNSNPVDGNKDISETVKVEPYSTLTFTFPSDSLRGTVYKIKVEVTNHVLIDISLWDNQWDEGDPFIKKTNVTSFEYNEKLSKEGKYYLKFKNNDLNDTATLQIDISRK